MIYRKLELKHKLLDAKPAPRLDPEPGPPKNRKLDRAHTLCGGESNTMLRTPPYNRRINNDYVVS